MLCCQELPSTYISTYLRISDVNNSTPCVVRSGTLKHSVLFPKLMMYTNARNEVRTKNIAFSHKKPCFVKDRFGHDAF